MKITIWAHATNRLQLVEREVEVDDADWAGMSEIEKHEHMLAEFWNQGLVNWGWDVKEENENA